MADTINAYEIGQDWTDLNTLTGIAVGTRLILQNINRPADLFYVATSPTEPAADFKGVSLFQFKPMLRVTEGEERVWVKFYQLEPEQLPPNKTAFLQVQTY